MPVRHTCLQHVHDRLMVEIACHAESRLMRNPFTGQPSLTPHSRVLGVSQTLRQIPVVNEGSDVGPVQIHEHASFLLPRDQCSRSWRDDSSVHFRDDAPPTSCWRVRGGEMAEYRWERCFGLVFY